MKAFLATTVLILTSVSAMAAPTETIMGTIKENSRCESKLQIDDLTGATGKSSHCLIWGDHVPASHRKAVKKDIIYDFIGESFDVGFVVQTVRGLDPKSPLNSEPERDDLDATATLEIAESIALDYATDNFFSDILDGDSRFKITLVSEDVSEFVIRLEAEGCNAIVGVNKELGIASTIRGLQCSE